jgi:putative membrane protein
LHISNIEAAMTPDTPLRRPALIEVAGEADPGLADPIADALPTGTAMELAAIAVTRRKSPLTRFALWAFGAFFSFAISIAAYNFVVGLLASHPILGWIASTLLMFAVLAALLLALRELSAYARLVRLDSLRMQAEAARATTYPPHAGRWRRLWRCMPTEPRRHGGGQSWRNGRMR